MTRTKVLYHLACAAPPALDVDRYVRIAQEAGWDVCVIATPRSATWLDLDSLQRLTGHPVRTDYKLPGAPDVLPPHTAITVGPITFNTINKWALGIADNLVLGLLTEGLGLDIPIAALPYLNSAQASHPSITESVTRLRDAGAVILLGDENNLGFQPHNPGHGDREGYPWESLLHSLAT